MPVARRGLPVAVFLSLHPDCWARPELYIMNKAIWYIVQNELACRVTMVHMVMSNHEASSAVDLTVFHSTIAVLSSMYPKLTITALAVRTRTLWRRRM